MKKIKFGKISANFGQKATTIQPTGSIDSIVDFGAPQAIEVLEDDKEGQQMKEVMGISAFGKKAKTFDINV